MSNQTKFFINLKMLRWNEKVNEDKMFNRKQLDDSMQIKAHNRQIRAIPIIASDY